MGQPLGEFIFFAIDLLSIDHREVPGNASFENETMGKYAACGVKKSLVLKKQALRNSCELLRKRKELHTSS